MPTKPEGTVTADAVAAVVGGSWINAPSANWRLGRIVKVQTVQDAKKMRHVLVPVKNPKRALSRLDQSALPADAVVLLVHDDVEPAATRFPVLRVESVESALTALATARRNEFPGKMVAVTGSVGKTSTTAMIGTALSAFYDTYWSQRTENDLITVRKHCVRLRQEAYAVVEISRLGLPDGAFVLRPDVAVVTAISEAHLQDMGSLEGTARFKAQIFAGLNSGGTAVVNRDTPHADVLLAAAREHAGTVVTYGTSSEADVQLLSYDATSDMAEVEYFGTRLRYQIGTPGSHNALNSVATLCAIGALGEDVTRFAETFGSFRSVTGRGETTEVSIGGEQVTVVDHSFNANPLSVRAALEDFAARYDGSRRVLVLGEMRELGPREAELHAELLDSVLQAEPALVYVFGPLMEHLWSRLPQEVRGAYLTSVEQVRAVLESDLRTGDAVLVKASRATGLYELVAGLSDTSEPAEPAEPVEPVEPAGPAGPAGAAGPAGPVDTVGSQSWRVTVSGPAVQGVGLRRAVRAQARAHRLRGWVRNRSDGKVEMLLAGQVEQLAQMQAFLHTGPAGAEVDRVVAWRVDVSPHIGFWIRRRRTV